MEISLNNNEWFLMGYYPWVPLMNRSMETGLSLKGVTDWIPATVPGGVHYDLFRAGCIEHPHVDMNSLKCEWVEHRWWVYKTTFDRPESIGRKVELILKGLDYKASVYLNGTLLGHHEGMFHPAVFDITALVKEHPVLVLEVMFEHAPDEMQQIGMTSRTRTQKSRFNYKWDFSTRMVNVGIWDDVLIKVHQDYAIREIDMQSDVADGIGLIQLGIVVENGLPEDERRSDQATVCVTCTDPDGRLVDMQECELPEGQFSSLFSIQTADPLLWFPNGYGDQPLYEIKVQVISSGRVCDELTRKIGIRKLGYTHNVNSPEGALPYTVVINGRKIYLQGANMTPLDLLYGNVTAEHYEWLILMMKKANMNMVRIWGGGVIEKEKLYDLCDRHGILIWQEFIQSSSGIDNSPSKIPEFLALLEQSAVHALKTRRNHVALTIWSGGNELMSAFNLPATCEDDNIAMLQRLVHQHDPTRLFLPTSASGPVEFVTAEKGISHDVHGQWKYLGHPDHYALYGESDCLFHSEFGVDGMSPVKSLRKFISSELLTPRSMDDDLVWRHHGEWWDTLSRDEAFFGPLQHISLFVQGSQWIQAEGLRYILEANRRRKFSNSGSLIWQLNEPWPNISCTSLIDYYGESKMAYYWVRKAFAPLHVSMDYRKLSYREGETFKGSVFLHGRDMTNPVHVTAETLDVEGRVLFRQAIEGIANGDQAAHIADLNFEITDHFSPLFFVRFQIEPHKGGGYQNIYYFSKGQERLYESARILEEVELQVEAISGWLRADVPGIVWTRNYVVTNIGKHAALHVYPEEITNDYWMEAEGSFETIFPQESRVIAVHCSLKRGGGFLLADRSWAKEQGIYVPEIVFKHFAQSGESESRVKSLLERKV